MKISQGVALALLGGLVWVVRGLQAREGGGTLVFALWVGVALGLVLQRSRFCFYCHARDWLEDGDPRGLLAILLALAVGLVGVTVLLGSWVAVPQPGQLPPDMHIGPVSWALVAAGLAFGLGMVVSGSCISAHWYRLAEGSPVAPWALLGTALGFVLGFRSWNALYSEAIADAPVVWLPAHLGYGGALLLQLGVLAVAAAALWQSWARKGGPAAGGKTGPDTGAAPRLPGLPAVWQRWWTGRWPYWVGGLAVGLISVATMIRVRPLGVTATLGSATRQWAQSQGWTPLRLDGLDTLGGCATAVQATLLTPHALVLVGLLAGSWVASLQSGQWAPRRPSARDVARGLGGGVLLGWGAMTGLGCTIGTLLSGTMAGALSGWVFGIALFMAVALGLRGKAWWLRRPGRS